MFLTGALGALATFLLTVALVPALAPAAARLGLVDRPEGRRRHAGPTPSVGGLAILAAAAAVGLFALPHSRELTGLGLAAGVIVIAGVADDRFRIAWRYRLAAQILAALVMIEVGGIRVDHLGTVFGWRIDHLGAMSIPLTVVASVGIINAVNMADGVDGLAAAMSLIAVTMLAAAAAYAGNDALAQGLGLIAGALAGFMVFNLRTPWRARARVFLGNSGAELLGLLIASACFRLTQNPHHPVGAQLAPFLLAPALIDCLTLMLRRARAGRSPFLGDRNHLHHLLLDAGASASEVVVAITAATLAIGVGAALALRMHLAAPWFSAAFIAMWALYFAATHSREGSVAGIARALAWLGPVRLSRAARKARAEGVVIGFPARARAPDAEAEPERRSRRA